MSKKILIVDDDMINRKLISTYIKKTNDTFIEASNGAEALDILKKEKIDIILLDLMMPVMNGIEFLQTIRHDPNYMGLPVIVLTTDDTKKDLVHNLGANDFITKPVNGVELLEKLKNF